MNPSKSKNQNENPKIHRASISSAVHRDTRGNALAAGDTIMITQSDSDTLAEKNREHLRKAMAVGEYITERDSMFHRNSTAIGTLSGELFLVDKGSKCKPIRSVTDSGIKSGYHILVRYTDNRKRHWFAWIHA